MHHPRVKRAHRPVRRPDGRIWIGSVHFRLATELADETGVIWEVCQRLDGTRTTDEVVAEISAGWDVDPDSVAEVVEFLIGSGWVEDAGAPTPPELSPRELERYGRGIQLQSWLDQTPRRSPYDIQAALKRAKVTIIGVGGIGSAIASSLVASGVGRVHCVDGDVVELSNLNRQIMFTERDLGRPKVEALAERLRALNGDVEVTTTDAMLGSPEEIAREVRGADVFAHCADMPRGIEFWSNGVAVDLGVPWTMASYTGPMLGVASFIPGRTGCYACLMATEKERMDADGIGDLYGVERTAGFNPVMAPTAQMSGHLAALEIIYQLAGLPVQTAGRQLHRNFLDYDHQYYIEARPRPDCAVCGQLSTARPSGVRDVAAVG